MKQYKVSLHRNMRRVFFRDRTLIWDKGDRPTQINRLVKKKITGRLAEAFINLQTEDNRPNTLEELMTTHLGKQWLKDIDESKVKEYETI